MIGQARIGILISGRGSNMIALADAVRAGRVPCLRVGRHIRFTRHMLEDWLAEQAKL